MPKKFNVNIDDDQIDITNEVEKKDLEKITENMPSIFLSEIDKLAREKSVLVTIRVPLSIRKEFDRLAKKNKLTQKGLFIKMVRSNGGNIPEGLEKLDKRKYYKI